MNRDQVRVVFGSEQKRRALKTLWKDDASFEAFEKQMKNAAEFNAMRNNVTGNSKTQKDLADHSALYEIGNTAFDPGTSSPLVLARRAWNWATKKVSPEVTPETFEKMAAVLFERDPDKFRSLFEAANAGRKPAQITISREIANELSRNTALNIQSDNNNHEPAR